MANEGWKTLEDWGLPELTLEQRAAWYEAHRSLFDDHPDGDWVSDRGYVVSAVRAFKQTMEATA